MWLTLLKGKASLLWAQYKLWIAIGLLLFTAFYSFRAGKESCEKAAWRAIEREMKEQQQAAAKAIKRAAQDAATLSKAKERGDELVEEAQALPVDTACKPTDDELRILREARQETAGK